MKQLKYLSEYLALRMVATFVSVLPYRVALGIGWINAAFAYLVARDRVAEAKRRIRSVFGERLSEREVSRIAWISWRNTVFHGVEMFRLHRMRKEWLASVCEGLAQVGAIRALTDVGQGCILAVPHMGSWEMAGQACHLYGVPMFSIAGRQRNPLVNRYLKQLRAKSGASIERGAGTMRSVLRKLRHGGALAILPDVRMRDPALAIDFLGGKANLGAGMALFAWHTDVPIFPCTAIRKGWARHEFTLHDPVYPDKRLDKESEILRMTQQVVSLFDEAIRRQPEQWFWFNKRWVLDPVASGEG